MSCRPRSRPGCRIYPLPPSRPSADSGLAAVWRQRSPAACLLYPVSVVFCALSALRRIAYRFGLLTTISLPVPVVVVGNITVGGSGKTPLVVHLAKALMEKGRRPGVITRGYRGSATQPAQVPLDGAPETFGDEALLLARNCACPVFVGRDRAAAGGALLASHPECDVILSDDGLQHYRLARDVELAVFDSRGIGNGWCLPAGPLRESVSRLTTVDALVLNEITVAPAPTSGRPLFRMTLEGNEFRLLDNTRAVQTVTGLSGLNLHVVAGIGAPERFFAHLRTLGLEFTEHAFPDHHWYSPAELDYRGDAILTTEKDAVKLATLKLSLPVWVLPVTACLSPDLGEFVLEKLNGCPPA